MKKETVFTLIKLPSEEVSNTERSNNALKQKNVHSFMTQIMDNSQFLLSVTTKFIFPDQVELIKYKALNMTKYKYIMNNNIY